MKKLYGPGPGIIVHPINLICDFAVLLYFVILLNPDLHNGRVILYYTPFVVCLIAILFQVVSRKFYLDGYCLWRILLIIILGLSYTYALDKSEAFRAIKVVTLQSIFLIMVASMIQEKRKNLFRVMNLYVIAAAITGIYIVINADISLINGSRLGRDVLGDHWNANFIGNFAALSFILILTRRRFYKQNKYDYILLMLFAFLVAWSGSRNALLIFILGSGMCIWFNSRSKRIKNAILAGCAVVLLVLLVLKVPFLYNLLGYRIESLFYFLSTSGTEEGSINIRVAMIQYGIECFKSKPILGYGMDNYRVLYGAYAGWATYSHNNYIELLVGIGLIGTVIYYSLYLICLRNGLRQGDLLSKYFMGVLLILLICDISTVSYDNYATQLLLCLGYEALRR